MDWDELLLLGIAVAVAVPPSAAAAAPPAPPAAAAAPPAGLDLAATEFCLQNRI